MASTQPGGNASLDQWLAHLETLHPKAIDMGLDRIRTVAQRLDLTLPFVKIVVAGTNGKGSTCAMLEAILLSAGYRVGLYTSPHLVHFNERIRVNGENASDEQIIEQFERIEAARGEISLSYFEFATLAALLLFDASRLDAAVLEVGMGGRLDAVNIVDADCSIVTSVDIDHAEWLGDTREKIGVEKAHVFRAGRPAICADPSPPDSIADYAGKIGADLWQFGKDFNYSGDRQQWAYGGRSQRRNGLAYPALRGANQLLNASAALAAIESLRDKLAVPQQAVRVGLLQVSLPGRMQILPGKPAVVLDVAHNPHAAAALAQNLAGMAYYPYTHAVVGMLRDKDAAAVLAKLVPRVDHWYCATLEGPRGSKGEELAEVVRGLLPDNPDETITVSSFDNPVQAFAKARELASEDDRILVFGSFSTVGPILQELGRTV
ncbi:bifunctional tetrahydrofolate synthase/dihydrofolate synthase [Pusillimonas caeni]|uniref:bifunctional tetrahydrofolate synthase/dihydrofolate synthase n=1 Tax=Pusillimonas caeni TaxID=1348472 RepID=UPI000E599907|nr:bifunctional tetrahydrofolate synthase/dihydrofolate synthase [Pusillimonas caeni]TFL11202.1 bifunctional tetrahydrofolate synthase/dihydrofolate synthase [Pusillimonas caeni]